MPLQYFYPTSDDNRIAYNSTNTVSGVPSTVYPNLYSVVDEGVQFANDSDKIIFNDVAGQFTYYSCGVDIRQLTLVPKSLTLNVRYSGLIDITSTNKARVSVNQFSLDNLYLSNSGTTFLNQSFDITGYYKSGLFSDGIIPVCVLKKCDFTSTFSNPKFAVSAIEVVASGNYFVDNTYMKYYYPVDYSGYFPGENIDWSFYSKEGFPSGAYPNLYTLLSDGTNSTYIRDSSGNLDNYLCFVSTPNNKAKKTYVVITHSGIGNQYGHSRTNFSNSIRVNSTNKDDLYNYPYEGPQPFDLNDLSSWVTDYIDVTYSNRYSSGLYISIEFGSAYGNLAAISEVKVLYSGINETLSYPTLFLKSTDVRTNLDNQIYHNRKYYPIQDDYISGTIASPTTPSGLFYTRINKSPSSGTVNDTSFIYFNRSGQFYNTVINLSGMPTQPTAASLNIRYSGNAYFDKVNLNIENRSYFSVDSSGNLFLVGPENYFLTNGNGFTTQTFTLPSYGNWINKSFDITSDYDWNYFSKSGCFTLNLSDNGNYNESGVFGIAALEISVDAYDPNPLYFTTWGKSGLNNNVSLFMSGMTQAHTFSPLFIKALEPNTTSNSKNLFLKTITSPQSGSISKGLNLFTPSANLINSGVPLFTYSNANASGLNFTSIPLTIKSFGTSINQATSLFLKGFLSDGTVSVSNLNTNINLITFNSVLKNSGIPLFVGAPKSGSIQQSIPLYLQVIKPTPIDSTTGGSNGGNRMVPLFISNIFGSGNKSVNLFIHNTNKSSGSVPLFIKNTQTGKLSGQTTLFIAQKGNVTNKSGQILFYTKGNNVKDVNTNTPLFISGKSNDQQNNSLSLSIYSTSHSGIFKSVPIYVESENINSYVPLFIKGSAATPIVNTNVNLFLNGQPKPNKSINMTVWNNTKTIYSGVKLSIKGYGVNDGFYILKSGFPLFIARDRVGTSSAINMYINGPKGVIKSLPMVISGGTISTKSLNLVIPNTISTHPTGNISLIVHGF
jgi:hypothetical protein